MSESLKRDQVTVEDDLAKATKLAREAYTELSVQRAIALALVDIAESLRSIADVAEVNK